jgi:glucose/arabinose dehydrogenase
VFLRDLLIGLSFLLLSACGFSSPEPTASLIPPTSSLQQISPSQGPLPTLTQVEIEPTSPTKTQTPGIPTVETPKINITQPSTEVARRTEFPDPQEYRWEFVANGLSSPVGLANAPDGSGRLFVIEQEGFIRIVDDGQLFPEPFLDLRAKVGSQANEQGLLGLAFHPRYIENGYLFVNYTDKNGDTVIARFTVSSDDPNRADPESEKRLMLIKQPYGNHNGGAVAFGMDGLLYLGLGDGGSANDPQGNAQSTNTHLGKILRIDINEGEYYAIPPNNPFVNGGGLPEIWAYGLRNPWRFSFDRLTGDMYIGDVGQNTWEEINFSPVSAPPGANFGWDYREGTHTFEGTPPDGLNLIDPVVEYDHSQGCSVTGGVVYRGQNLPTWQGIYLYGDFCSGKIWGLTRIQDGSWSSKLMFETGANITSFGEDEAGEVYLVVREGGIYKLTD